MDDLFGNPHVNAALYFTDQGQYLFKYKNLDSWRNNPTQGESVSKTLREPEVCAAFTRKTTDSGWLQNGIIRVGNNSNGSWYVFWSRPTKAMITFGDESLVIPIPATVLISIRKEFFLYALATDTFNPQRAAFHAPFPNVHVDGRICWGKNASPKAGGDHAQEAWNLFFQSPFNGDLVAGKSTKFPDDIRKGYPALAGKKEYPVKTLKPLGESIGKVIDHLIGRDY